MKIDLIILNSQVIPDLIILGTIRHRHALKKAWIHRCPLVEETAIA